MSKPKPSPERILPTRMRMCIPAGDTYHFSTLDFPYYAAYTAFMERFKNVYHQQHGKDMPYALNPSFRQLNNVLLALAPEVIQGFESYGKRLPPRVIVFTRSRDGHPEEFPTGKQLQTLIRRWLERWAESEDVKALIAGDAKAAWETLCARLKDAPERDWQHGIRPADLLRDIDAHNGLAYSALPALLTALLHKKHIILPSQERATEITWRRVNSGEKRGLHLVSQPFSVRDAAFAYRLDFTVQTQVGRDAPWVFLNLSKQRYITKRFRGDPDRNLSVLVGWNRERFASRWDNDSDTTLIRLPVEWNAQTRKNEWADGVSGLLDDMSMGCLIDPEDLLTSPCRYGHYDPAPEHDKPENEYYLVYAEGRKFGDGRGSGHPVKTGTSLHERGHLVREVMALLVGWLEPSPPLEKDQEASMKTMALRNYDYMVKGRNDQRKQQAAWRSSLQTSLKGEGKSRLHLAVLYRSESFSAWAEKQIAEALMGADSGENPLVTVTCTAIPLSLQGALDDGGLDPKARFSNRKDWNDQMRKAYGTKRDEWRAFLQQIAWEPGARRLALIDSYKAPGKPNDQQAKGAIRDACHREQVGSQFIIGEFKEKDGKLDGGSKGRLKNAVLDLLVRQQGILYAPPREIYLQEARLDAEVAGALDVVAFCRIGRTNWPKLSYVLAVRLRADGQVNVLLPEDKAGWISYGEAAHRLGILFSEERVRLTRDKNASPLRMKNDQMGRFAHEVLTTRLERPTIAVIEAEGWRNARQDVNDESACWIQLANPNLNKQLNELRFGFTPYRREASALENLLCVVRLRMDDETPQYVTADMRDSEELMLDIPHLTGYIDPVVPRPLHYMSVAGLPETQKDQRNKNLARKFSTDIPESKYDDIAFKHAQLIEMIPFFVHPRFQGDEGQRSLCRCVHFLRISPAFTMGEIALPYPMHLGEKLIEDRFAIIGAED